MRNSTANHNSSQRAIIQATANLIASQRAHLLGDTPAARTAAATTAAATTRGGVPDVQLNATSEPCPVESLQYLHNSNLRCDVDTALKCDPELGRIAVGLRLSAQLRIWLVIEEHARQTGYNWIEKSELKILLSKFNIRYSDRNFDRWLYGGNGVFWQLHQNRVWLIGYRRVAESLCDMALTLPKGKRGFDPLNLVITNHPGFTRSVYINVASANLNAFEAQVYAGWLASRNSRTISRYVLSLLFRRDPKVIRRWDKLAGVIVLHTFAHYTEATSDYIPLAPNEDGHRGGVIEYEVNGHRRWSAEYSNTYQPPPIRQHPYRGQSLTVSRKSHLQLQDVQAAGPTAQIPYRDGRLHRTGCKLFDDIKIAKLNVDDDHRQEQYLFKSADNRRTVHIECVPDGRVRTRARECERAGVVLERCG